MNLHSNRWTWRGSRERGVVGDGDRVLWGLRGLYGRSQLESLEHGRFDPHRLQHLAHVIVTGQAASAAGNVAGSVRDGVASVCQVTERCAWHSCFSTSSDSLFWGIQISNPRIEQTASAVYALSKDKDCVAILVASHFIEFKLFSGRCGSGKSASFVLQVCSHK